MSFSPGLSILRSKNSKSLMATAPFKKDAHLFYLRGTEIKQSTRTSIQVGPNLHVDFCPEMDITDHSCEPNGYVDFSDLSFRAIKDIDLGEKITFNYLTTEWDMSNGFDCLCGSDNCFRSIRGYKNLAPEEQARLESFIPSYFHSLV